MNEFLLENRLYMVLLFLMAFVGVAGMLYDLPDGALKTWSFRKVGLLVFTCMSAALLAAILYVDYIIS